MAYIIGFFIASLFFLIGFHNGLLRRKHEAERALSTVEVVLSERHHLLGQLREALQLQSKQQELLLLQMSRISEDATTLPALNEERARLEHRLSGVSRQLATVMGQALAPVAEGRQHLHFQHSIREIEAQLSAAWRAYNAAAMEYNHALDAFPTNILGQILQLEKAPMYFNH